MRTRGGGGTELSRAEKKGNQHKQQQLQRDINTQRPDVGIADVMKPVQKET